jgi:hypothetical protein
LTVDANGVSNQAIWTLGRISGGQGQFFSWLSSFECPIGSGIVKSGIGATATAGPPAAFILMSSQTQTLSIAVHRFAVKPIDTDGNLLTEIPVMWAVTSGTSTIFQVLNNGLSNFEAIAGVDVRVGPGVSTIEARSGDARPLVYTILGQ